MTDRKTDRETDHATRSVTIDGIYVRAMRSNNIINNAHSVEAILNHRRGPRDIMDLQVHDC